MRSVVLEKSGMIRFLQHVFAIITGRLKAGRAVSVLPDDIFVVSYPNSGADVVEALVLHSLGRGEEDRASDVYCRTDAELKRLPRPRVLLSHEPFDARFPRVVYVVRDPRQVLAESCARDPRQQDAAACAGRWIAGGEVSIPLGSWLQNVGTWMVTARPEELLLVRYEDVVSHPEAELARIAAFVGGTAIPLPDPLLAALRRPGARRSAAGDRIVEEAWPQALAMLGYSAGEAHSSELVDQPVASEEVR